VQLATAVEPRPPGVGQDLSCLCRDLVGYEQPGRLADHTGLADQAVGSLAGTVRHHLQSRVKLRSATQICRTRSGTSEGTPAWPMSLPSMPTAPSAASAASIASAKRSVGSYGFVSISEETRTNGSPPISTQYPTRYLGDTGWKYSCFLDGAWTYPQVTDLDARSGLPYLGLLIRRFRVRIPRGALAGLDPVRQSRLMRVWS
jgi:hypothetical protein